RRITIISAETDYFFSRTALMYVYMGHMKFEHIKPYEDHFWDKNRIELIRGYVTRVDPEKKTLTVGNSREFIYDKLIIATGSKPNKFGWPGQDLHGVQGLYSKQDLDLLENNAPNNQVCKHAVIVGGGLIGIELAEMLSTRNIPVTFLVREKNFWDGVLPDGEAKMINEHIREHHIDLQLGTNLVEILSNDNGRVKAVVTDKGDTIPCNIVGLTPGVTPNIGFLEDSGIEMGRGIKVNRHLETSHPDVYAIGDCAEQREAIGNRRPIEAVWYTGRMMGETVAQTICGNRIPYSPGHWFNSAKFFDIEYQTYGWVFSNRNKSEEELHFHWRHPDEKICVTLSYHRGSRKFLGINTFGIRMRHEVFDNWLNEERSIDHVMEFLADANFDPEFYQDYEKQILDHYNQQMGTQIKPAKKSLKRIFQLR
ncbi:MAG: NAD(P)/FAD-dependent oxidoreductase, partial [Flavobacteriaceae bacterium]|nr:NAD(P)/FAD-dependent oxidoreductase [Flavobacteriaceae bacterium]